MAIKLTDELVAATAKGKIAQARQVFMDGDEKSVQEVIAELETPLSDEEIDSVIEESWDGSP